MDDTQMLDWLELHNARIDRTPGLTVVVRWWSGADEREAEGVDLRDAIRGAYVGEHVSANDGLSGGEPKAKPSRLNPQLGTEVD